ncbi:hypothetical protein M422DRAFT_115175, partial [Sphaerobolus stellatus SS14]
VLEQEHEQHFPVLACVARDVLCIPGVSVSVERLFSSSRSTLTDYRSRMTIETASKAILTKERLKKGFGQGI